MLAKTNLENCLQRVREKHASKGFFEEFGNLHLYMVNKTRGHNQFKIHLLNADSIYHLDDIKKLCVDYRLRFLDFKFFKNSFPIEASEKLKDLEQLHETEITQLKVVAPSKLFRLENADDPMLFASLGNDYFYLIHKWGNDLHPLRKLLMWPYKDFENLVITIFAISILATFLVPNGLFSKEESIANTFVVFLFMFKWLAAVVLFYGFALGKNFNTAIWNSKYFNA
tara:strand:+ start:160138 stop:160815 length:678 start_codon:yes stop_codon:yes gene_type:complete